MDKVLHAISGGAAQSWQLDNLAASMHERRFDFGFAVDLMRKDIRLCRDEALRNGSQLPLMDFIDTFYAELQRNGSGRLDTSSLITLIAGPLPADCQQIPLNCLTRLTMPLVRIDLRRGRSPEELREIRDSIYQAMRDTFDVIEGDRFILVSQYDEDEFDIDPTYAGMSRSSDLIIVQISCNTTRGLREKNALFRRMNDLLVARCMVRRDDVFISLIETPRLNWSFGRGEP